MESRFSEFDHCNQYMLYILLDISLGQRALEDMPEILFKLSEDMPEILFKLSKVLIVFPLNILYV